MGIPITTYSLNPMIFLTNHPLKRRCVFNYWKLKICVRIWLVANHFERVGGLLGN